MSSNSGIFDRRNPRVATIWSRENGYTPIRDDSPSPFTGPMSDIGEFEILTEDESDVSSIVMHRQYDDITSESNLDDALYSWYCFSQGREDESDEFFIALTQQTGQLSPMDRDHILYAFRAEAEDGDEDDQQEDATYELIEPGHPAAFWITDVLTNDPDFQVDSFADLIVLRARLNS